PAARCFNEGAATDGATAACATVAIRTIGTVQCGVTIDTAGAASAPTRPSVHTRCRADADARRSASATIAGAPSSTDALTTASMTRGRDVTPMTLRSALARGVDQARQSIQFRG